MGRLRDLVRIVLLALVARPFLLIATGLRITGREHLPAVGPAVIAANHNSHLDVLALLSLFPARLLPRVRPVAAADTFLRPGLIGWLARSVLAIIPIDRSGQGAEAVLEPVREALRRGEIVIIFPEGSRGEPEVMSRFKRGASVLASEFPTVPFVPVHLHGLGKSLPRGDWRFVPFAAEAHVAPARTAAADPHRAMSDLLHGDIAAMAAETELAGWAVE